ncbi:MAG: glycosyltransferase family 4 protein [Candidatus Bathyarchaeia archaeon]|jgi:glycosyltransferase involved in cell wall biosynthesis
MRVIQVTPRYYPTLGGVEVFVQKISELLAANGHEVTVYSVDQQCGLPAVENINGVTVKRFKQLFGDPLYLPEPKFSLSLRKENADIIHAHNIHTFPQLLAAVSKHQNQRLVLQPHYHRYGQTPFRDSLFKFYQKAFYDLLFLKSSLIVSNSVNEKKAFREDFPNAKGLVLLPEGLDTKETRSVQYAPVTPKRILFVGVLKRYKNVHKLIEAFAWLTREGKTDYRLIIVGDGPEHFALSALAVSLGLEGMIEWKHGLTRAELLAEYAKASVFVMLSQLESFSRVVYDALFIGVPVVVYNFGVLGGLVSDGLAEGVNSLAPKSVAEAVVKASQKSYRKISSDSKNFLDWETYVHRLTIYYNDLLAMNQ